MVLLVLVGFAGACLMAWNMPVVWRYETPPAGYDGHVSIIWPLLILVQIDPARRGDVGLHAHEQVHVDQFQRFRPIQFVHWFLYQTIAAYRYESELSGYRAELEFCASQRSCARRFAQSLAKIHTHNYHDSWIALTAPIQIEKALRILYKPNLSHARY